MAFYDSIAHLYDRIIDQDIDGLPTIENEHIRFVRNYHFKRDKKTLEFESILIDKCSGKELSNSIRLYPLRKNDLNRLLHQAGFQKIIYYGNFKKEPVQENSMPLVVEVS